MRTVILSLGLSLVAIQPLQVTDPIAEDHGSAVTGGDRVADDDLSLDALSPTRMTLRGGFSFDPELLTMTSAPPAAVTDMPPAEPRATKRFTPDTTEGPATTYILPSPPRLSREETCRHITSAAQAYRLPVNFFSRLIWQESEFDPNSVSRAGAKGIAQFMPETAALVGLANPFDPVMSLSASAQFLHTLLEQFGNLGLAAAAYNAGPGRVMNWIARKEKQLPAETRHYVITITGHSAEEWRSNSPPTFALQASTETRCQDLPDAEAEDVAQSVEPKLKLVTALLSAPPPESPTVANNKAVKLAKAQSGKRPTRLAALKSDARRVAKGRPIRLAATSKTSAARSRANQKIIRVAALGKSRD